MGQLTRAQLLGRGVGGGVALAAGGAVFGLAGPAAGGVAQDPTEDDLATVRLAASSELLAQAFYTGALASKKFTAREQTSLRRALDNEKEHYDTLAKVLGATAPVADDFEFAFPKGTFTNRYRTLRVGSVLETVFVGSYASAAATLNLDSLRATAAQIAAAESRHLGVLADLRGGSPIGAAFPPTFDVEQASTVLDPFFGQ